MSDATLKNHKLGEVSRERFTGESYPFWVVWGRDEQAIAYIPCGWPKSHQRALRIAALVLDGEIV